MSAVAGRGRGRGRGILSLSKVAPSTVCKIGGIRSDLEASSSLTNNNSSSSPPPCCSENNTTTTIAASANRPIPSSSIISPSDTGEKKSQLPPCFNSSPATTNNDKSKKNCEDGNLEQVSQHIEMLTFDAQDRDLDVIEKLTRECAHDETNIQQVIKVIYNKSLVDLDFARTGAMICDRLSKIDGDGVKYRTHLLKLLQNDFADIQHHWLTMQNSDHEQNSKEMLRASSHEKFNGLVVFLCQVYVTMRTVSGEPFKALVNPIFQCLEMLLKSATSDELETLNSLLQCVGKQLEKAEPDKMQDLLDKIRLKIIQGSNPQVRCYLLEIIEIQAHNWEMLPSDITRFYCDTSADILAGMVV